MTSALILSTALFLGWSSVSNAQAADGLVMNTPMALTTCQNASLSWTNAPAGPVFLSVVPGGQPAAAPLVQFNTTDGSEGSLTWLVDLPADEDVTILIADSTGKSTGSAAVKIKKGVDESCIGKGQSAHPGTAATTPSTSPSSASSGSSSGSTSASTSTSSSPSTSGSSTGASKPATSSSSSTSTPATDPAAQTSSSTTSSSPKNYTTIQPSVPSTSAKTEATDGAIALHQQSILCVAVMVMSLILNSI